MWFAGTHDLAPIVWFKQWPLDIQNKLVTRTNPNGSILISDLELMGIHMHWLVLKRAVPAAELRHVSPAIWCNNLLAVSWIYKFRTSKLQIASNILLGLAMCLHERRCSLLAVDHISGLFNVLADFASRKHTTNPAEFLSTFAKKFPHRRTIVGLCSASTMG